MIKLVEILSQLKELANYQFKQEDVDYDEMDNSLLSVTYTFNTQSNPYRVVFHSGEHRPEDMKFELSFGIDKGEGYSLDTQQMTGEGNVRMMINTIAQITQDFLQKFPQVNKVIIDGTDDKRTRVYKALFPKYLSPSVTAKVDIL